MRKIVYLIIAVVCALHAKAVEPDDSVPTQPIRPIMSAYMVDIGGASVLDTYLSPIRYKGVNVRVGYERLQAMKFNPDKWIMQKEAGIDYSPSENPVGNHTIHALMADFKWGMMHRWRMSQVEGLQLFGGGSTQLRGGALYAPANSNNVVSVKINWSIDLTGMAVYNRRIGKLPITFRYQATLPVMGVMYSPEYGETYYEMYVGNHSGLVHFGWVGNRFAMTNLFTADMHLGRTTLRVGYRNVIETSWINNLNTQIFRNSFVLGVSGEWMQVRQGATMSEKARIISAIY